MGEKPQKVCKRHLKTDVSLVFVKQPKAFIKIDLWGSAVKLGNGKQPQSKFLNFKRIL